MTPFTRTPTPRQLHLCGVCASPLVEPDEASRIASDRWLVALRCPECGWHGATEASRVEIEALETVLDHAIEVICEQLTELARERFVDEIERFAAALAAGAIEPMDF